MRNLPGTAPLRKLPQRPRPGTAFVIPQVGSRILTALLCVSSQRLQGGLLRVTAGAAIASSSIVLPRLFHGPTRMCLSSLVGLVAHKQDLPSFHRRSGRSYHLQDPPVSGFSVDHLVCPSYLSTRSSRLLAWWSRVSSTNFLGVCRRPPQPSDPPCSQPP